MTGRQLTINVCILHKPCEPTVSDFTSTLSVNTSYLPNQHIVCVATQNGILSKVAQLNQFGLSGFARQKVGCPIWRGTSPTNRGCVRSGGFHRRPYQKTFAAPASLLGGFMGTLYKTPRQECFGGLVVVLSGVITLSIPYQQH